jgi:hypothetical protein
MVRAATGRAVITDFGLSRVAGIADLDMSSSGETINGQPPMIGGSPDLTKSGELLGTPAFMAPEQLRAGSTVGPAADVYAAGLVLFEAATGVRPHPHGSFAELAAARLGRPTRPVASLRSGLPKGIARIIDDCLIQDVAQRIADGSALVKRIDALHARPRRTRLFAAASVAVLAAAAITWFLAHRTHPLATLVPPLGSTAPEYPAAAYRTFPDGLVASSLVIPGSTQGIIQGMIRRRDGDLLVGGHTTLGFTLGGVTFPLVAGAQSAFLIDLTPSGTVRWQHVFHNPTQGIHLIDMIESHGAVIVVGSYNGGFELGDGLSLTEAGGGLPDCYIASFDAASGVTRWAHRCGSSTFGQAHAVVDDADGNLYVGGWFNGQADFGGSQIYKLTSDSNGAFAVSYTADGKLRWVTPATEISGGFHVLDVALSGSELILAGTIFNNAKLAGLPVSGDENSDGFVIAIDAATGKPRLARTIPGGRLAVSSVAAGPPGLAITGEFLTSIELVPGKSVAASGPGDTFVAMLDPKDLHTIWATTGGGVHNDGARDIAYDGDRLIIAGRFILDQALGGKKIDGLGGGDGYVAALDAHTGAVTALHAIGGPDGDRLRTVHVGEDGLIRITGTFRDPGLTIAGITIPAVAKTNGFAIELRDVP